MVMDYRIEKTGYPKNGWVSWKEQLFKFILSWDMLRVISCLIFLGINAKSNGPNLNVKVNSSSEPYRINIETLGHTSTERIVDLVLHEVESDNRTNCCIDQQRPLLSGIFSKHLFLRAILGRKSYRTKLKFIVTATQPHTSMVATQGSNQGGWTIAPGFLLSPTKWGGTASRCEDICMATCAVSNADCKTSWIVPQESHAG